MNLQLNEQLAIKYKSNSQKARVLSEDWVSRNMYCPICGNTVLKHSQNNKPVSDFYCEKCYEQYELKSINGEIRSKISDGAYGTFIERIQSRTNPNFLFMSYCINEMIVQHLSFVPKFFFIPEMVEKRKALSPTAKRAGWVGCNILYDQIPEQGIVHIVKDQKIIDYDIVKVQLNLAFKMRVDNISSRGWMFDVLQCINSIKSNVFSLSEVYMFESVLANKYQRNMNVRAKIRQQLQLLRDKGIIVFLGNGYYRKV